eukprot:1422458-Rhodomonas_salina.2
MFYSLLATRRSEKHTATPTVWRAVNSHHKTSSPKHATSKTATQFPSSHAPTNPSSLYLYNPTPPRPLSLQPSPPCRSQGEPIQWLLAPRGHRTVGAEGPRPIDPRAVWTAGQRAVRERRELRGWALGGARLTADSEGGESARGEGGVVHGCRLADGAALCGGCGQCGSCSRRASQCEASESSGGDERRVTGVVEVGADGGEVANVEGHVELSAVQDLRGHRGPVRDKHLVLIA